MIFKGADGTSLHVDELGDPHAGIPLLVLSGGAARHPEYLGDLAGLADRYPLLIPHLRGVGRSPAGQPGHGSFWDQAEDIEALREHLGLDRLRVLGHSAGTRLALSYAARYPARVEALVLLTPPAGYLVDTPSDVPELVARRAGDPVFDAAARAWAAGPDLSASTEEFQEWHLRSAPLTYASWGEREQAHAATGQAHPAAARAFFAVATPADLASRLGAVHAPVLVVGGAEDCTTGVAQVQAVAGLFPAGRFVAIERAGHFPWVEQPLTFALSL